jgi:hypothetical protein
MVSTALISFFGIPLFFFFSLSLARDLNPTIARLRGEQRHDKLKPVKARPD